MIYVLRTKGASFIKVGHTNSAIEERMGSIQTGCPYVLELIHVESGDIKRERWIHDYLKKFRASGEWFHATPIVYKKLGIPEDCQPLNPKDVGLMPSHRQYWLSYRFVPYRNADWEHIISLKDFCNKYKCTEEEVFEIDPKYAEFHIVLTTTNSIKARFNYSYRDQLDDTDEYFLYSKSYIESAFNG